MSMRSPTNDAPPMLGRYAILGEIGSGGMATVHLARLVGSAGFSRLVAIKRMHPHLAKDAEFVAMFLDEARLSAQVHHPNVVPTLDIVAESGELFVVMEYVHGESLAAIVKSVQAAGSPIPVPIVSRITYDFLSGLHAAHDAGGQDGQHLGIVHRDVSPHNVLVGADGVTRVIDFGIAKAAGRLHTTRDGQVKGKLAYMAPEQLLGYPLDRRTDIFAASIVLWELLTGRRLFLGDNDGATTQLVLTREIAPPSSLVAGLPFEMDAVVLRGLERRSSERFSTARAMAAALQAAGPQASAGEVAEWLEHLNGGKLPSRVVEIAGAAASDRLASGGQANREETLSDVSAGDGARLVMKAVTAPRGSDPSTAERPVARARGRRVAWVSFAAVAATGALFGAIHFMRSQPSRAAATPMTTPDPPPSESAPPAVVAVPPASASPPEVASTASHPPAGVVTKYNPRPPSSPRAADCNPPYVVDSLGVRTYKKACVTGRR